MITLLAMALASTVAVTIGHGLAGLESVRLLAVIRLVSWIVVFYFVRRTLKDLRPDS